MKKLFTTVLMAACLVGCSKPVQEQSIEKPSLKTSFYVSTDTGKIISEEEIKEYFYTAKHNAKIFITRSRFNKEYTNVDDNWYNSNVEDLCLISNGATESILDIKYSTKRQIDTINEGRTELEKDYYSILKYVYNSLNL